jgi:hypothetical protein
MANWKSIRLELASTSEFPSGSVGRAYLVRLPIDDGGRVDEAAYRENPSQAVVRRYWSSDPDQRGKLLRAKDGWIIHCNGSSERILELDGKSISLGQELTIHAEEGKSLPFRVATIR